MSNSRNHRLACREFSNPAIATPVEDRGADGDGDPQLPAGYRHINSAILAVLGNDLADDHNAVSTQS